MVNPAAGRGISTSVTQAVDAWPPYVRYVLIACIALLLLATFRLYTFAYFWIDDFNNLYWTQLSTLNDLVGQLVSPSAKYFRPAGMLTYWMALHFFGLDAFPYHILMWAIHSLNVLLVYILLKHLVGSRAGAAVGAMLFAFPPPISEVFFSFGTIFELQGLTLFLCGMILWTTGRRSLPSTLLATVIFLLALKTKEMAITLPVIWVMQDVLARRPFSWRASIHALLPLSIGVWFGIGRMLAMRGTAADHAYFMDLSSIVLGGGFGYYFNTLFQTDFRWQVWSIGFVVVALAFLGLKAWRALFFQLYVFVTFLPLIFLVNHREPFYWYFPIVGVCGCAALGASAIVRAVHARVSERRLAPFACGLFALFSAVAFRSAANITEERRIWQRPLSQDFRAFIDGIQRAPTPASGDVFYFESVPDFFTDEAVLAATQVALRRTDIEGKRVDEIPTDARYRFAFKNSRLERVD